MDIVNRVGHGSYQILKYFVFKLHMAANIFMGLELKIIRIFKILIIYYFLFSLAPKLKKSYYNSNKNHNKTQKK